MMGKQYSHEGKEFGLNKTDPEHIPATCRCEGNLLAFVFIKMSEIS
jgi:hypothetical protein